MKKFIQYAVILAAAAYYAVLPFVVAQAGENPSATGTGAATAQMSTTTLYMRITAYASVPDETDSTPFITADGSHVYSGEAASNNLPFGTKIEIPQLFGDEVFTIHDRMSTKIKNTIDIWMPTVSAAIRFGMSHATIIVLGEPTSTQQGLSLR
jgi:3D (Asp-Asp-Asp) domain-containing protein